MVNFFATCDDKVDAVPDVFEFFAVHPTKAERRITDKNKALFNAFDDDEVTISIGCNKRDARCFALDYLFKINAVAVRLIPARGQKIIHIQQRKALTLDRILIAIAPHALEHVVFVVRLSVMVGQQGRERCRAAAEVKLLAHHRVIAGFHHALWRCFQLQCARMGRYLKAVIDQWPRRAPCKQGTGAAKGAEHFEAGMSFHQLVALALLA